MVLDARREVERSREAEELHRDMKEAGGLSNTIMIFGQMNEPPGARFRVGHAALSIAEYFRDHERQNVLLLIDNIFRFVQSGTEVSARATSSIFTRACWSARLT